MKIRDAAERLFWTFVDAFLGTLVGSPVIVAVLNSTAGTAIDLSMLGLAALAATIAALVAVANALTLIARWRLSVLPNPGAGLPGLPVEGQR